MSDLKRFFKHSSIYAVGNVINRIGAFVLLPVYTNYLTVADYGVLELFYVMSSVVSGLLAIGLAHATLRFYFEYDNQIDRNSVISTNFIGSLIITIIGVFFLAVAANDISIKVFNNEEYNIGIYLILITLIFELSSQICLAYIRAVEYSVFFVIISIAKLIIQVAVNTYLVIVMDAGVNGVLLGNLITVFVGWLVLAVFTISKCGLRFELSKFKPVIKYSFPFLLSTILGLISTNIDKFILNYLVSLQALGLYALALKFSMIIEQLIGEPFSRSYGAFRYTIMKNDNANQIQANIVKYLFVLAVSMGLGMSFFVRDILMVMSDKSFWAAADIVPVIMLSTIAKIMTYPAQSGILFAKKTKYFFYFTAVASIVNTLGSIILITYIGLLGACLSLVVTEAVVMTLTHRVSQKYFFVKYDYKSMIMVLTLAIVLYFIVNSIGDYGLLYSIAIKFIAYIVFVFILLRLPVLNRDEKLQIKTFISQKIFRAKSK